MKCRAGTRHLGIRRAVAALIAAWMALVVVIIGAHDNVHGVLLHSQLHAHSRGHSSVASRSTGPGSRADVPRVDPGAAVDDHEPLLATASLQSAASGMAGGVVATAHVPVAGLLASAAAAGGGTSCGSAVVLAGQDRLTRLCVFRR